MGSFINSTLLTMLAFAVLVAGSVCSASSAPESRLRANQLCTNPYWQTSYAATPPPGPESSPTNFSKTNHTELVTATTLAGVGVATAWGLWKWDYFSTSPTAGSEGWFGNNTDSGGADKLGHFYTTYVTSHALAYFYETQGMHHSDAAFYGAFSSFVIMGYVEVGDSFSSYGFSYEDMIANTLGCLYGYYAYKYPSFAEKVDVRVEFGIQPSTGDILTDYENTKFLLALKLNGLERTRHSFLKHLEIHAGYYTRGFDEDALDRERNLFIGVGLNFGNLLKRQGYRRTSTLFNYVQLPYTSLQLSHDTN